MANTKQAISVVIPTYNGLELLKKHLPDVVKVLEAGDEIVVVDDASTDKTVAWLEELKPQLAQKEIRLSIAVHSKNQRFAAAVNTGVEKARHDHILLLNNDVSPISPDIKNRLLSWFAEKEMFAVGCAEVTNLEPQTPVSGRGTGNFERGLLVHWYDPGQESHVTLWAGGGSMMFDRTKFRAIGGMDTLYYPAYEEDRDLSYRALKHGWKVVFEPKAKVLHQHESTNASVFGARKMEEDSWKNQYLLVWKNITDSDLWLQHWLWLPYHLIISNQRTNGAAWRGFRRALGQLSEVRRKRRAVKALWVKTDRQVLREAGLS